MNKTIISTLTIITSLFLSSTVFAGNQGAWWINAGAGFGYYNFDSQIVNDYHDDAGPAAGLSFNYMTTNDQLLTLRSDGIFGQGSALGTIFAAAIDCIPAGNHCEAKSASVVDVSALYGLIHKTRYGYLSASAGLGMVRAKPPKVLVNGVEDPFFSGSTRYTVALPLEIQAFWTPAQHFGLGLIAFGSVTAHYSNVGALLAIQFGRLVM